jgi:hypothetical protein
MEAEMIIWRITGNAIGPNDAGAYFFALKSDAEKELRGWRKANPGRGAEGPEKIEVKSREQLAELLNDAMGFGTS